MTNLITKKTSDPWVHGLEQTCLYTRLKVLIKRPIYYPYYYILVSGHTRLVGPKIKLKK